jgi:hypothetical protein
VTKIADLETLDLLHRLPDDAALTTAETAVFLRLSVRQLERMRRPGGGGPAYMQYGVSGSRGANQKCLYRKRDLVDWQTSQRVSDNVEAAVRKGQLFRTVADVAEERPYWLTPDGKVGGAVEDTSVDIFFARLGKWEIVWLPADEAACMPWSSTIAQRDLSLRVCEAMSDVITRCREALDRAEVDKATASGESSDALPGWERSGGL